MPDTPPPSTDEPTSGPIKMASTRIAEALERATARRDDYGRETWSDEAFREQRDRDIEVRTISVPSVMRATLITLLLAMLLTSGKLVEIAERQPLGGATRDFWLPLAEKVDRTANFLSLNRPADLISDIRGTGAGDARTIDDIRDLVDEDPVPTPTTTMLGPAAGPGATTTLAVPSTTTAPPQPLRTVTGDDPLRIYFGGDSQARYPAQSLELRLEERGRAATLASDAEISTGLARPDVYNWPAQLLDKAQADSPPEAVIVLLGANDKQDMVNGEGEVVSVLSPEWRTEYATRVAITMDLLEDPRRRVLWVGQPPMRDAKLDEAMRVINEIDAAEAASRPWVEYVDISTRFADSSGGYADEVDDGTGTLVRVRQADGVHLNERGAAWLSEMLADELERLWTFS